MDKVIIESLMNGLTGLEGIDPLTESQKTAIAEAKPIKVTTRDVLYRRSNTSLSKNGGPKREKVKIIGRGTVESTPTWNSPWSKREYVFYALDDGKPIEKGERVPYHQLHAVSDDHFKELKVLGNLREVCGP